MRPQNTRSPVHEQVSREQPHQVDRPPFMGRVEQESQYRQENNPAPDQNDDQQALADEGLCIRYRGVRHGQR